MTGTPVRRAHPRGRRPMPYMRCRQETDARVAIRRIIDEQP
ncbi:MULTISPECIES: hypothetical protein [unclassified Streptomyces]|nr:MULTISPECIES: hypothetical protein [unclassified Streptomyces]